MRQLVRVAYDSKPRDRIALDGDDEDRFEPPADAHDDRGFEVDVFDPKRHVANPGRLGGAMNSEQEVQHLIAAEERAARGQRLSAAIAPHADVRRAAW